MSSLSERPGRYLYGPGTGGQGTRYPHRRKRPGYTGSDCDQSQSRCQTGRPGPQCRLRLGCAGAFSDGKLTLTTEYGGNLDDYMPKADLMDKIRYVDEVYCRFGGADRKVYGDENKDRIRDIKRKLPLPT